jgi:hypothetical protein
MSNPDPMFDPENVKEEDNTDWDLEAKQARIDDEQRLSERMEEHFTREPNTY